MNVFLYARVSTPEQAKKDLSIPDQLRQLHEYCQQNNHIILKEYIEPGVTATDDKRPAFQQMIGDAFAKENKLEAILVLTTSRFFRDALKAKVYKRKLKKVGIKVIAIKQETTDDPMGNFIEGIFELIDQYESETNGFHTLRGMKENARKGYCNGATAPYGYKRVKVQDDKGNEKTKLKINPTEAETVRLIFNLYLNGDNGNKMMGSKLVAIYLNEHGFRRRSGQKWSMQSVLAILSNSTYAGTYYFNKRDSKTGKPKPKDEWIPIKVPAIIEKNIFEKVQEIIDKRDPRKTNPAVIASPSLLLGLLKCGKCGASMIRETGKSNQYNYYNCRTYMRQGKPSCTGQRVPRALFEKQVLEHLADKIFSVERTKILLNELYKAYKAEKEKNNERLNQLNEQLKEIQKGLNNQYMAIERGIVDLSDVKERINELKRQKEEVQKAIEQLKAKFTIPVHLFTAKNIHTFQKQLKDTFTSNNSILTKNYLKALVERITLRDRTVHIEGKIHGALQLMAEKEKAVGPVNPTVPTAVLSWLPGQDSNLRHDGYSYPLDFPKDWTISLPFRHKD
jgi:DNA invertase Pin-like site-specific DNA recombinase/archaellum component FlaC